MLDTNNLFDKLQSNKIPLISVSIPLIKKFDTFIVDSKSNDDCVNQLSYLNEINDLCKIIYLPLYDVLHIENIFDQEQTIQNSTYVESSM